MKHNSDSYRRPLATANRRRGIVLIETALVLLLLVVLTMGGLEYGLIFLRAQEIAEVSRHGARLAVTPSATNAQVLSEIESQMNSFNIPSSAYTVTFTPENIEAAAPRENITVRIELNYRAIGPGPISIIPTPATLRNSTTMVKEG